MLGLGINISKYQQSRNELPLDLIPGAAAAYSLREVTKDWKDMPVIRVREGAGNSEQDFTATEILDGTLTSFTSTNVGYIVRWYDQSGNSRDAIQSTSSRQGLITGASGSYYTLNGIPTSRIFEGDFYNLGFTNDTSCLTIIVAKDEGTETTFADVNILFGSSAGGALIAGYNMQTYNSFAPLGTYWRFRSSGIVSEITFWLNGETPVTDIDTQALHGIFTIWKNGMAVSSDNYVMFSAPNSSFRHFEGYFQELLLWHSDVRDKRISIESNINSYYAIY